MGRGSEPEIWSDPDRPCLDQPEEWFFPNRGGQVCVNAKRVCASCPGRVECLEFAVVNVIDHGVFGGTSPAERRRIRARRARDASGAGVAA